MTNYTIIVTEDTECEQFIVTRFNFQQISPIWLNLHLLFVNFTFPMVILW